jgi:hypothetical protein
VNEGIRSAIGRCVEVLCFVPQGFGCAKFLLIGVSAGAIRLVDVDPYSATADYGTFPHLACH